MLEYKSTLQRFSNRKEAKKYFGKSRGWLMQKVNGNKVNGKVAAFTDDERILFRRALQDLSEKMSAVAMNL